MRNTENITQLPKSKTVFLVSLAELIPCFGGALV